MEMRKLSDGSRGAREDGPQGGGYKARPYALTKLPPK